MNSKSKSVELKREPEGGEIQLGDIARDTVTGFEGVVYARHTHINNCPQFTIQPSGADPKGAPMKPQSFDAPMLIRVCKAEGVTVIPPYKTLTDDATPRFGDKVKDRLTGLSGLMIGKAVFHGGCVRLLLQPTELVKGLPVRSFSIDESDAIILEKGSAWAKAAAPTMKEETRKTGGPRDVASRRG